MIRKASYGALLVLLAGLSLVACSSKRAASDPPATHASTTAPLTTAAPTIATVPASTTTTKGTSPTTASPLAHTYQLTDAANGKTLPVAEGSTINVLLSSTYWTVAGVSSPAVLQQVGPVTTTPAPASDCVPGEGCGTVTVTYRAVGVGHAQISASRTTCGEALRCTATNSSYTVEVEVIAG